MENLKQKLLNSSTYILNMYNNNKLCYMVKNKYDIFLKKSFTKNKK